MHSTLLSRPAAQKSRKVGIHNWCDALHAFGRPCSKWHAMLAGSPISLTGSYGTTNPIRVWQTPHHQHIVVATRLSVHCSTAFLHQVLQNGSGTEAHTYTMMASNTLYPHSSQPTSAICPPAPCRRHYGKSTAAVDGAPAACRKDKLNGLPVA